MAPRLSIVRPAPPPAVVRLDMPAEGRRGALDVVSKARSLAAIVDHTFTTPTKLDDAERLLGEIETVARNARLAIRRGR